MSIVCQWFRVSGRKIFGSHYGLLDTRKSDEFHNNLWRSDRWSLYKSDIQLHPVGLEAEPAIVIIDGLEDEFFPRNMSPFYESIQYESFIVECTTVHYRE